ncbi:MAG: hypothetical protein AAFU85_09260 [Planctomycetota bacterium]
MISISDRQELTLIAMRHGFSGVGCEVRDVADRLLNAGVDHDALVTIYLAEPDDGEAIVRAMERFLIACNIRIPDRDTAIWGILEYHIDRIARRSGDPLDRLREMMDAVYYEYDFREKTIQWLGDSHGIHHLVGYFWVRESLMDRPDEVSCNGKYGVEGLAELKNEIVEAAKTWLDQYSGRVDLSLDKHSAKSRSKT